MKTRQHTKTRVSVKVITLGLPQAGSVRLRLGTMKGQQQLAGARLDDRKGGLR